MALAAFAALGLARGAGAETFAAGDKVIALWGSTYYSGTVNSVDGANVIVAWDDGSSPSGAPVAETMRVPEAGAKPSLKAGDAGYCNFSGTSWQPCLVTEPKASTAAVANPADGSTAELALAKIVIPTGEIAAKLAQKTAAAKAALELKQSIQAKSPPAGVGSEVQRGDWVLALWNDGKWWEARVLERQGSAVRLLWSDGSVADGISLQNVAPYPSLDTGFDLKAGDIIYVKWTSVASWYIARIDQVLGPDALKITYQDGSTGQTRRGRYLAQQGAAPLN
jgi:hypothetical protein